MEWWSRVDSMKYALLWKNSRKNSLKWLARMWKRRREYGRIRIRMRTTRQGFHVERDALGSQNFQVSAFQISDFKSQLSQLKLPLPTSLATSFLHDYQHTAVVERPPLSSCLRFVALTLGQRRRSESDNPEQRSRLEYRCFCLENIWITTEVVCHFPASKPILLTEC